jgi:hypothetical protein
LNPYRKFLGSDQVAIDWDVLAWPHSQMMQDHADRLAFEFNQAKPRPRTVSEFESYAEGLRQRLSRALGLHLLQSSEGDIKAQIHGELDRGEFIIQKLTLETLPGVTVPANLYLPKNADFPVPAVLCPHGHWAYGRFQQEVQARCIALARMGYVVLSLDAYGFGERWSTGHGEAFFTLPAGLSLGGLLVWDNMRAVDYVLTRNEVDPDRLAITGASGGGNQTMYTAALDERLRVVVPAASVSSLQGLFFRGIGCICECTPNLLRFADLPDVLKLIAPRPLLLLNTILDDIFPIAKAREVYCEVRKVYKMLGVPERLALREFFDQHAYNQEMRETLYGWLEHCFRGRPFEPVAEPPIEVVPVTSGELQVFEGGRLPAASHTLLSITQEIIHAFNNNKDLNRSAHAAREKLQHEILGGFPQECDLRPVVVDRMQQPDALVEKVLFWSEEDILIPTLVFRNHLPEARRQVVVMAHPHGKTFALTEGRVKALLSRGLSVVAVDVRGVGETSENKVTLVQNSLVYGRPLVGEWAWDILRSVKYVGDRTDFEGFEVAVWGVQETALSALLAAILHQGIARVACERLLASYLSENGYGISPAHFVPRILEVGDIPELVGLIAPRPVHIAGPISAQGKAVEKRHLASAFESARAAFAEAGFPDRLTLDVHAEPEAIAMRMVTE